MQEKLCEHWSRKENAHFEGEEDWRYDVLLDDGSSSAIDSIHLREQIRQAEMEWNWIEKSPSERFGLIIGFHTNLKTNSIRPIMYGGCPHSR